MLKLLTSQNVISGMGKRFNGIWSKNLRQIMEKAITEKMDKIVQLRDKGNEQQKLDEFKNEINELKKAFLTNHQEIEKEFNEKLKKMIGDQQQQPSTPKPSVPLEVNVWNSNRPHINVEFSADGLEAKTATVWEDIIAVKGFPISSYEDGGKNMHYYEITQDIFLSEGYPQFFIGLTDSKILDDSTTSYEMKNGEERYGSLCILEYCWIAGNKHHFEWPNGIKPEGYFGFLRDVGGCGILVNRRNELAIFFTADGTLLGKQIPIMRPTANCLYPTVTLWHPISLRANFGDDLENHRFKYDIGKCPGLSLE